MKAKLALLLTLALTVLLIPAAALAQQAAITIDIPLLNEAVSPVQVVVQGTGTALPENNVVVQALDAAGNVLVEQATTVTAEPGGTGPWRAVLDVNAEAGSSGQILAFSPSPADGTLVAQAAVPVTYGQAAVAPTQEPEPELPIAPTEEPEPELPIAPTEEPKPELPIAPTEEPVPGLPIAPTPTAEPELPIEPTATPEPELPIERPSAIRIRIPLAGEEVSPFEVVVVGDGANLPENNVVVQALDADGEILDQMATTVNAPLGEVGEWRALLRPSVEPGTKGEIYAFSTSPKDGSVVAEASVPVSYGSIVLIPTPTTTPLPAATISISIPASNEVVSPEEVVVIGAGSALPENNVVVQALDTSGAILDQQVTIVNAQLGGTGEWRVVLSPQVAAGTLGRIYAFSPSPKDNSIVAETSVNVTYGSQTPVTPSVSIVSPQNGQTVNATNGFAVSGTAQNIFENTVIVRVRDGFGRTIQQGVATADANGDWSAGFRFLIENGASGSIYAFSTSPADGSIIANDGANVTYASNCVLRTDWPAYVVKPGDTTFSIARSTGSSVGEIVLANCLYNPNAIYVGQSLYVPRLPGPGIVEPKPAIAIDDPEIDGELPINAPFAVSGTAVDLPIGHATVRLLDNLGNVIDETRVSVPELPEEGESEWLWTADLLAPDVTSGTRGQLFIYSLSPSDGRIVVYDMVDVVFGADEDAPFVSILEPAPYAMVDTSKGEITISGRGRGLFENNVVVAAVDVTGELLVQAPTTMTTEEIGGEGIWEIALPIDAIIRGRLIAFSPSPAEGDEAPTEEIETAVDVFFGDPANADEYSYFTHPLPNTVFTNANNFYAVAGYANSTQNVNVIALDQDANIHLWMPVEVDAQNGFWSATSIADEPVEEDLALSLRAFTPSPLTGRILNGDRLEVVFKRNDAYVTGSIVYRERIALPEDAVATVTLVNASLADAPPEETIIGTQVIEQAGQVPIAFAVGYNSEGINDNLIYSVDVRIEDGESNLLFISTQVVPVITDDNPTEGVEVLVEGIE